jgi:hypothetical protein
MNAEVVPNPVPHQFHTLVAAAIADALIVLLLWFGIFYANLDLISGHWWLLLFWLWLVWPLLLVLHPVRIFKRVAMPVAIGVALLVPCFPTAFAFTAWTLGGFAP